jgi:hypothetical protein
LRPGVCRGQKPARQPAPCRLLDARERYFVEAEPSDPRTVEALAFIRTLYAVEREIRDERERLGDQFAAAEVVRRRQTRAGPILATFADWLEEQRIAAPPKVKPSGSSTDGYAAASIPRPGDGTPGF